jgi:DASS family divalent anion:Na+ symporter
MSRGFAVLVVVYLVIVYFTNLAAGLTHFATTPGPIFYADGYVTLKMWWKAGAINSSANIAIWLTAGFAWWKFVGVW